MNVQWIRSYTIGENRLDSLRFYADDGSEIVQLEKDEMELICSVIQTEHPGLLEAVQNRVPYLWDSAW